MVRVNYRMCDGGAWSYVGMLFLVKFFDLPGAGCSGHNQHPNVWVP